MGRTIIVVFIILIALALLWLGYKFVFNKSSEGTKCSSTGGSVYDGTIVNGVCVKSETGTDNTNVGTATQEGNININPELLSSEVHKGSVAIAPNPNSFFKNINESNIASFNLFKSSTTNPQYINFKTTFSDNCPSFIWYKNWLYSFVNSKTSTGGVKTCYYKIDKSVFPNEIKVSTQIGNTCSNFKLFFSSSEYRYDSTTIESTNPFNKVQYCIYKKQ